MKQVEAVVFDADGTLFNTFELVVSAYRHVSETYGLPVPDADEIKAQMGRPLPDIFESLYPGQNVQTLLDTNNDFVAANSMKSEAFEGVCELLEDLTSRGIKLSMLTSGGSTIHSILKRHDLDTYFASVVHHERIKKPKPDPEGFYLACKECGAAPQHSIMVGDTIFDIRTGQNAHALATIALTHGYGLAEDLAAAKPDYIAHDLSEVGKIIANIL
jgi:phosphoglycolate phosphatase